MMGTHNCQRCKMLCVNVHPLCMWCRTGEPRPSQTVSPTIIQQIAEEPTMIVRFPDKYAARINRREAQARRRARVSGLVQLWAARILLSVGVAFVLIRLVIALGDLIVRAL